MAAAAVAAQGGGRTQGKAFGASKAHHHPVLPHCHLHQQHHHHPYSSSFQRERGFVGWEVESGGRFWGLLVGSSFLEEAAAIISMDEESVSDMTMIKLTASLSPMLSYIH